MTPPESPRPEPGTDAEAPGTGRGEALRESRLWPPNWPIRWKLSAVSAGLTFIILVTFGSLVGKIATEQLRNNFKADVQTKAEELVKQMKRDGVSVTPASATPWDRLHDFLRSSSGIIEVVTAGGQPYTRDGRDAIGPRLEEAGVWTYRGYQYAVAPIYWTENVAPPPVPVFLPPKPGVAGWLYYGRPVDRLEASIGRLRFAILAGVIGATLLAWVGAVILSRRALRPISTLTATAGEIARTRDPEVRLEEPVTDDEVAELTRTFSGMLHELSISRAEEERLLRRQREFVADASHELRTPLTSVLANLELLEESLRAEGSEDDLASVASALRSSRRMRRLVTDLQTLARIDVLHETTFESLDLARIAADAVREMKPLAENHELVLHDSPPVPVKGAPDDLHRVVANLVGNAVHHVPEGCRIEIATAADRKNHLAVLTVSDDGPGIPPEIRTEIFGRFVQGTGRMDRSGGKGTGLGLAIVKAISESHGGTVEAGESDSGGASFTVTLPLAAESTPVGRQAKRSSRTSANR